MTPPIRFGSVLQACQMYEVQRVYEIFHEQNRAHRDVLNILIIIY